MILFAIAYLNISNQRIILNYEPSKVPVITQTPPTTQTTLSSTQPKTTNTTYTTSTIPTISKSIQGAIAIDLAELSVLTDVNVNKFADVLTERFMLDYHSILTKYSEVILRSETNAKCAINKILFNSTFAMNMTEKSKSNHFNCQNLPRNESVVEARDLHMASDLAQSYQLHLRVDNLQKLYKNISLDPAIMTCYAEKFEKSEGKTEYRNPHALQMSNVKIYFNSSNDYKIVVKEHG